MNSMDNSFILFDKKISISNIKTFIRKINNVFSIQYLQKNGMKFSLWKTKEIDFLSIVLLYKFLEYSVVNKCFYKPTIYLSDEVKKTIKFYRFHNIVTALIEGNDIKDEFNSLKIEIKDDFIIAPIALSQKKIITNEQWNKNLLPNIMQYYHDDIALMIFQFFIELYSNFTSHANDETRSIMVAHGTKNWIEIVCIDNGIGIVNSLRDIFPRMSPNKVLEKAMCKYTTSKSEQGHMGYGLWYINEIVKKINGRLEIWSNNAYYKSIGNKTISMMSPNWQGTILYIKIPLNKVILLDEIDNIESLNEQINFI